MKKLRSRLLGSFAVAVAIALVVALPAGALAAETGTEAPIEPAPAPESTPPVTAPGSTGWVPQSPSTGSSSGGPASTQQGSSLGSGGSSQPSDSSSDEPSNSGGSSEPVEPEVAPPPTPSVVNEQPSEPRATAPVQPVEPVKPPVVEPEPAPVPTGRAGLDAATLVARPEPATIDPVVAATAPAASAGDQNDSGSGVLPVPVLILCGLFLLYAGARLVLGPVEPDLFRSKRFRFLRRAFDRT